MRMHTERKVGFDRSMTVLIASVAVWQSCSTLACNSIFGIEQLYPTPDAAARADAGHAGVSGGGGDSGSVRTDAGGLAGGSSSDAAADAGAGAGGTRADAGSGESGLLGGAGSGEGGYDGGAGASDPGTTGGSSGTGGSAGSGGSSGTGGSAGSGGSSGTGGSAGSGGSSGTGGSAGSSGGAGWGPPVDAGADSSDGETLADASSDEADATLDGGTITISGTIIDSWRRPVSGALVAIGNTSVGTTDQAGHFFASGITPPYDVMFYVGPPVTTYYVFDGLTRTDPTLQTDLPAVKRQQTAKVEVTGGTLSAQMAGQVVFASPGGVYASFGEMTATTKQAAIVWDGPADAVSGTSHLLRVARSSTSHNVDQYAGYQTVPITLEAGSSSVSSFDMSSSEAIPNGSLEVTANVDAQITVFVHFDDTAVVPVIQDSIAAGVPTSYNVPNRSGWSYSVVAATGAFPSLTQARQIVHKGGLTGASSHVDLELPPTATPLTPGAGATGVATGTVFTWSGPPGFPVNTLFLQFTSSSTCISIVTTRRSVPLPNLEALGFHLPAAANVRWYVQTTGAYTSTDEAAGSRGQMDTFNSVLDRVGPEGAEGLHTISRVQAFTTAP